MKLKIILTLLVLCVVSSAFAQDGIAAEQEQTTFDRAFETVNQQLQDSVEELAALREQITNDILPLSRELNNLESRLTEVRAEYQQVTRHLDSRTLDLTNLKSEIKSRSEEATYLSNLLSEYTRNFESRLHIAEIDRYAAPLEEAKLAMDNPALSEEEVYAAQSKLLIAALGRLEDALGGTAFDGTASDSSGSIHHGTFALIGPSALFKSDDGKNVGTAETRLGSLEPTIIGFDMPDDEDVAMEFFDHLKGYFPFDPTLGSAHKIEQIKETVWDEVQKGGVVMYPIIGLAAFALLFAVCKLAGILITLAKAPSEKQIRELLSAVAESDQRSATEKVNALKGPVGAMLKAGVEHLKEPVELIEEVMYEKVMAARLKLDRFLPFISVCAASAPLLGLLGTVTGIINTFALITVFGSGDVKSLSGGISEALITTKYGLIVAIPSLLLHAFLSRMAKGVQNQMEAAGVALINQLGKTPMTDNPKKKESE
ncbi:MAG: MotA/TolQ/ExbB proton channel family protein [Phycisphaerae bacterium]|jgi:biopolymer transport protein ExbB